MEFSFFRIISTSKYDLEGLEGLYDGILLREHARKMYENMEAISAQQSWHKHVPPLNDYKGELAASFKLRAGKQ